MGPGAMTNRFRRPPGDVDVADRSLERRISELEQVANAQRRQLRIKFERIAQLQAEWDVVPIRSSSPEYRWRRNADATTQVGVLVRLPCWEASEISAVPAGSSPVTMRSGMSTASCQCDLVGST